MTADVDEHILEFTCRTVNTHFTGVNLVYVTEHHCCRKTAEKEEENRQFLIPLRESSLLLHPLWADSNEGPGTADGHLLAQQGQRKKKQVKKD